MYDSVCLGKKTGNWSDFLFVRTIDLERHKKEYGNADQAEYIEWFLPFAEQIKRILKDDGSFVLNVGGAWTPGAPLRSLYHYRLLLALCDQVGFNLCQEFFWYNPAKMPAPAEWVNVRRVRVKDSVEYIFWLSATPNPKADNTRVLLEYSADMRRLIKRGIKNTVRPSGHNIKGSFAANKGGSIPPNLIECGNNESNSFYIKESKRRGHKIHPARFPSALPSFFMKFLTEPGDKILDPFAGSNTTGWIAESLGRKWISIGNTPRTRNCVFMVRPLNRRMAKRRSSKSIPVVRLAVDSSASEFARPAD